MNGKVEMSDFMEKWFRDSEKRAQKYEEELAKICQNRKSLEILKKYGRNQERLEEIYQLLTVAGLGEKVAWKVIKNPKQLSQFFQWEDDEVGFPEIVSKLLG